ncbi:MAG: ABC transporter ATP-binding protein [Chloroflexi bacterium]|nr:ABC transporter ATP-binding protein [Chloroflexota bacterium]
MDGLAIATRGLVKRYGAQPALQGLDMNVPTGAVYGFLGPNGAGKTTLMRILVGLLRPDAGEVRLLGEPFHRGDRRRLFGVGSLIEQPAFYPYLSGRDNLRVFAAAGPYTPTTRIDEVLEYVGLRDRARSKVKTYSLGMKQRLGIAVALVSDPQLLLLDEPGNGLDPAGIVAMRELLRFLTAQGKTVLVSSHILPEVQQLADVVGIVDRGRLVREGPLERLLGESAHVRIRVDADEVARVIELLAPRGTELEPPMAGDPSHRWLVVRVTSDHAAAVNQRLAEQGVFVSGLETKSDLEALFLSLTTTLPTGGRVGPPWAEPSAGGRI